MQVVKMTTTKYTRANYNNIFQAGLVLYTHAQTHTHRREEEMKCFNCIWGRKEYKYKKGKRKEKLMKLNNMTHVYSDTMYITT